VNGKSTLYVSETGQGGALEERRDLRRECVPLEKEQLDLMIRIHELGSVGLAARALGISFREAWDRVMAINRLSTEPLIYRSGIGMTGGVTLLSEEGKRILSRLIVFHLAMKTRGAVLNRRHG
jgi:molybdate transport system regulatory protein